MPEEDQRPPVATDMVPEMFNESLAQILLSGPAFTVGLGVMLKLTLLVTVAHPARVAVRVRDTELGAAARSAAEGV